MSIRSAIVRQFEHPHGALGYLAGWIMANRPSNQERNAWTVDLIDLQPGDRVLELGCGPGFGLQRCLAKVQGGTAVGLDHSQTMLDQARRRNARAISEGRLQLRLGTIIHLFDEGGGFDKIYMVNVVQFLNDRQSAFQTINRLLNTGGIVACTYMPRHKAASRGDALQMAKEITNEMNKAGFEQIRIEELSLRPVPAVCVLGGRP